MLVAYFSASGVTAGAAKALVQAVGADLYEISPATPYTSGDLDWTNRHSRSSVVNSFLEALKDSSSPARPDSLLRIANGQAAPAR